MLNQFPYNARKSNYANEYLPSSTVLKRISKSRQLLETATRPLSAPANVRQMILYQFVDVVIKKRQQKNVMGMLSLLINNVILNFLTIRPKETLKILNFRAIMQLDP
jgi:K+-sensing histidine kinase KdpD